MTIERFNQIIEKRIEQCKDVLCAKANEYATEDRLHNFKVAAELQNCTPITALAGMMCKHTVSVYDLIREHEKGADISSEMWDEKIGDSINYLLLLTALIEDENRKKYTCHPVEETIEVETKRPRTGYERVKKVFSFSRIMMNTHTMKTTKWVHMKQGVMK